MFTQYAKIEEERMNQIIEGITKDFIMDENGFVTEVPKQKTQGYITTNNTSDIIYIKDDSAPPPYSIVTGPTTRPSYGILPIRLAQKTATEFVCSECDFTIIYPGSSVNNDIRFCPHCGGVVDYINELIDFVW